MADILWRILPPILGLGLIAALFSWVARRQQSQGKWLGKPQRATISWLGSYTEAFQRALDLLGRLETRLIEADPNHGHVIAATAGSLRSFGTTIQISLLTQEGVTFVQVEAAPAALFDGGESRAIVNRFLKMWDNLPAPTAG
jgi:hypothetical protein